MLLLIGTQVRAQSAATVPASSGVYDKLESVSALFPTRGVHLGQRPLSRRELQRVVARLTVALDSAPRNQSARREWARQELASVTAALDSERGLRGAPRITGRAAWRMDVFDSDAHHERINSNGLGDIDAVTHPFGARRDGWPAVRGAAPSLAPIGVVELGNRIAVGVEPRFSLIDVRDSSWSMQATAHRAYARGVLYNVAIQIGPDELLWGQSPLGAMFISGNASPFPAILIGTDTAIILPWLFRLAGPVRFTGLLADLGRSQDPPHTKLAGWQVSLQPWSRFELGVAVLAQQGGKGGPEATFIERVVDLLPIIDALAPQHADLQFSNKIAGGNLRLHFPELSGLDFYYELAIDDFDARRLRSSFVDDAGHLLGLRLPLVVADGQLSWRAEWHRTSLRLYEHAQFRSGVTFRERLIGDPLGPNATGAYLTTAWQSSPWSTIELALGHERRDPSQYTATATAPRDRGFKFVRVTNDPNYNRNRAILSLDRAFTLGAVRLAVGYNRAWRTGQPARSEWLGLLALRRQLLPTF